jgi:hypothetical protein
MATTENINFHESTLSSLKMRGSKLVLKLEDVEVSGKKSEMTIQASPIMSLTIDGEPSDTIVMEAEDGEVLSLSYTNNCLSMIVEWHNFSSSLIRTRSYKVVAEEILIFN